ncbi:MAG: DMT family transporter, partial [Paracoccaceae bacterium]
MRRETLGYFAVLILAGAGWGMTQPLTKIAVSTGHRPLGLVFWQQVLVLLALGSLTLARGKRLPLAPRYLWRYGLISLLGTVIPNAVSYSAAVHLPSGFLSIIISLVPMFSLPLALAAGLEHFSLLRLTGLVCGAVAITLLATPDANFSDPSAAKWVLIAAIAPLMYALEGTWVAKYGILDLDVMQLVLGASLAGLVMAAPFAVLSGQWIDPTLPWGRAEWALVMSALVHAFVYS